MTVATRTLGLDDLVTYCVSEILKNGEECTFERLVYECFARFPEAFGLKRYPHWPDSARVNKAWLRCRTDKGWIAGSVKAGFRLTNAGEHVARVAGIRLDTNRPLPTQRDGPGTRTRERYDALLRNVRRDAVFQRFLQSSERFEASSMELRRFLGATLETPLRILRQNLNAYRNAASTYNDEEVLDFLSACEKMILQSPSLKRERP